MKKAAILVCLLLCVAGFALAGAKKDTADKVTVIRVWNNDAHSKDEYTKAVADFNSGAGAREGIRIEYTVFGGDWLAAMDTAIKNDEEPEIYKAADSYLSAYYQTGKLLPLRELPDIQPLLNQYAPYQMDNLTRFDGVEYSMPLSQFVFGIAYNKDLLTRAGFREPPKTWDEFERACTAISKLNPGKVFGTAFPIKFVGYHDLDVMGFAVADTGHYQFDFANNRYKYTDWEPLFNMLLRIGQGGGYFPGQETLDDDAYRAQFADGNIAFCMGGSWNVGVLYDQFPAKMEWGVMPFPVRDMNSYYNGMAIPGSTFVVSRKVRGNPDLMRKISIVYRFIASDEFRAMLYTAGKDMPVDPNIIAKAPPSSRPQWSEFGKVGINAVIRPNTPDTFISLEGKDFYNVFTDILTSRVTPQAGLADLEKRYNEAFERAVRSGKIKQNEFRDPAIADKFKKK